MRFPASFGSCFGSCGAIVCLVVGAFSSAAAREAAAQAAVAEDTRAFTIASGGYSLEAPANGAHPSLS